MSGFGFQDSAEVTPGASGGKFGLNSGVQVVTLGYNPNSGKGNTAGDSFEVVVKIEEKEFRKRYFPVTKIFFEGAEIQPGHEKYQELYDKEMKMLNASLSDVALAFIPEDALKAALIATPINTFAQFAQIIEGAVKRNNPAWATTPVDIFLQYQWSPTGENTTTFLQFSGDVKHGRTIVKHVPGDFKQVEDSTGIKYVDEQGVEHPFKRNKWFAESNFANRIGSPTANTANAQAGDAMNTGATSSSGW